MKILISVYVSSANKGLPVKKPCFVSIIANLKPEVVLFRDLHHKTEESFRESVFSRRKFIISFFSVSAAISE